MLKVEDPRVQEFLQYLKNDGSYYWQCPALRTYSEKQKCFCPLTFAYFQKSGRQLSVDQFDIAASHFGFDDKEAQEIAFLADNCWREPNEALRSALLETCLMVKT